VCVARVTGFLKNAFCQWSRRGTVFDIRLAFCAQQKDENFSEQKSCKTSTEISSSALSLLFRSDFFPYSHSLFQLTKKKRTLRLSFLCAFRELTYLKICYIIYEFLLFKSHAALGTLFLSLVMCQSEHLVIVIIIKQKSCTLR